MSCVVLPNAKKNRDSIPLSCRKRSEGKRQSHGSWPRDPRKIGVTVVGTLIPSCNKFRVSRLVLCLNNIDDAILVVMSALYLIYFNVSQRF